MCSLPAFQVYGSWGVLFYAPYATILGGCASLLVTGAVDTEARVDRQRVAGAAAVLVVALLAYQPAAMFFWVFLAIALVGHAYETRRAIRVVVAHAVAAVSALMVAFLVLKLSVHAFGDSTPNASRSRLVRDVPDKLDWFLREPLKSSLNLFDLTPSTWLAASVAAISVAGIGLLLRSRTERPLLFAAVGAALVPATYLPNLVIADEWATYRTQVALSSLLALYASLGVIGLWLATRESLRGRLTRTRLRTAERAVLVGATAVVAVSALAATRNVLALFVEPELTELRMIRAQVATFPDGAAHIGFVEDRLVVGHDDGSATTSSASPPRRSRGRSSQRCCSCFASRGDSAARRAAAGRAAAAGHGSAPPGLPRRGRARLGGSTVRARFWRS